MFIVADEKDLEFTPYKNFDPRYTNPFTGGSSTHVHDLEYRVLRIKVRNETVTYFYFDDYGIWKYSTINRDSPVPSYLKLYIKGYAKPITISPNKHMLYPFIPDFIDGSPINKDYFRQAINRINPGDSISRFVKCYNDRMAANTLKKVEKWKEKYSKFNAHESTDLILDRINATPEFKRFILRIEPPMIEREIDNNNVDTFDFIHVYMSIPIEFRLEIDGSALDRFQFARENFRQINKAALYAIKRSRNWGRYGVPVNYLRMTECIITSQSQIAITYELKKMNMEDNDDD